jgi:nicotinate-nucleotide--dimethylbenzimidazole phosphoribosyltransferase
MSTTTAPDSWTCPSIPTLATARTAELQAIIDQKTKPVGSLGRVENLALRLGLMQDTVGPRLSGQVLVFAGDHGLAAEGVSPFPQEVTAQMVHNFLAGGAAINVFARQMELPLKVVDAGVAVDLPAQVDLINRKVRWGTRNSLHEPAMTRTECEAVLTAGVGLAHELADRGVNALILGEMGIGNTSSASLLMSAYLDRSVADCTGRGTGHDDIGLAHKIQVLCKVRDRHAGLSDPLDVLAAFGGLEIAMMAGAMLGAASRRMVVVNDGFICTAALLAASRLNPAVLDYVVFAHCSAERAHREMVDALGGEPLLDLGMRLGEGTGGALVWPLLQAAVNMMAEMATFASAGVSESEGGT